MNAEENRKAGGRSYEVQTAVRLLAPREVRISLVPLEAVERTEWLFFWASAFFGIFTALLGALVSLTATDFPNRPLLFVVAIFTVLFALLFTAFTYRAFAERRQARRAALDTSQLTLGEWKEKRIAERGGGDKAVGAILTLKQLLHQAVFHDEDTLFLAEFQQRLELCLPGRDNAILISRFVQDGLIVIQSAASETPVVKFNRSYDAETVRGGLPEEDLPG